MRRLDTTVLEQELCQGKSLYHIILLEFLSLKEWAYQLLRLEIITILKFTKILINFVLRDGNQIVRKTNPLLSLDLVEDLETVSGNIWPFYKTK